MSYLRVDPWLYSAILLLAAITSGCGNSDEPQEPRAFALTFQAKAGADDVGCEDTIAGLGPDEDNTVGVSDLRFYVSNVAFTDSRGKAVKLTLNENDFQYSRSTGNVALIDLTGNDAGSCAGNAIAFAEGTARTNDSITGETLVDDVTAVSFDVGVPQALMREVIAEHSAEGAPSPLNEMQWTWASGYRHFVMNFTIENDASDAGEGYVHLGSRACGPEDGLALEDRDECSFVNTPKVALDGFDLATNRVTVDLRKVLAGLDFVSPIYDPETFEVLGEGPGVECHSMPDQPDCATLFGSFGIDADDGTADPEKDDVFGSE